MTPNVVKARRIDDTGKMLGISRATIYRRIADGTLTAVQFGGIKLITEESINAALSNAPRAPGQDQDAGPAAAA